MIRRVTAEDMDWIMDGAKKLYEDGVFDEEPCRKWLLGVISNPNCIMLRGEKSVFGAAVVSAPYAPSVKVGVTLPIASLGNSAKELLQMTRMVLDWAKEQGATTFNFSATTGVDLGPLAKRFGGQPVSPAYQVRL